MPVYATAMLSSGSSASSPRSANSAQNVDATIDAPASANSRASGRRAHQMGGPSQYSRCDSLGTADTPCATRSSTSALSWT